jgi:hypothetical protein
MNLRSVLKKFVGSEEEDPREVLATLLLAAKADATLRQQIVLLLQTAPAQRESLINTALHQMRLRGESAAACAAFAMLGTEEGAKAALEVLAGQ